MDIRCRGIVVRRVNYKEADRILTIITEVGKKSVIAKSVRKAKSKLAGGIEGFSVGEFCIHESEKRKNSALAKDSEIGVLTGAKMLKFYSGILADYEKLEFAGKVLKKVEKLSEGVNTPEYFEFLEQVFELINADVGKLGISELDLIAVAKIYCLIRLGKISGEEINLLTDTNGEALKPDTEYMYDDINQGFVPIEQGQITPDDIKILRLISKNLPALGLLKIAGIVASSRRIARTMKIDDYPT